ncbi:MAG: hypothetical protein EAZ32_09990 [Cytophagia bacterium]|nr:MAG: hypothetical protein EAZ46_05570 [Runella sp.]TAG20279.1 MAG: hypothetical protein EAZ38_10720 [Cytophagales bacterium]TAG39406.1 MAG: hypothetical protein EAZ32_09990 [Cytophagia bacterium]TAG80842.1 MAG: hypothetical protein EAZ22_08525 [Cytophagales bacterium]
MKNLKFLVFVLVLLVVSCQEKNVVLKLLSEEEKNQRSIAIVDTVIDNLQKSTWKIKRVEVKVFPNNGTFREIGISKDTVLTDLAEIRFLRVTYPSTPKMEKYRNCWLSFVYKNQEFDVELPLQAMPEKIFKNQGPMVGFLAEVRPQGNPSIWPQNKDLDYINKLGFTDNFLLSFEGKQMIWKGLNRGLSKVVFERK